MMKNYRDHNIFIFDYPFDLKRINDEYKKRYDEFTDFVIFESDGNPRMRDGKQVSIPHWKVVRWIDFDYADELCEIFKIKARPRFLIQEANSVLGFHRDKGTECSINILLGDYKSSANVDFEDNSYNYSQCLLNTQNLHSVKNKNEPRVLFKLSILDESFDQVCQKIEKVI